MAKTIEIEDSWETASYRFRESHLNYMRKLKKEKGTSIQFWLEDAIKDKIEKDAKTK